MFKTDQLIYIEMQKTGCSHIGKLLSRLFDGQKIGKHNAAAKDDIASDRLIFSSIRNPWDWYLSLWTFGVQGGGAVRNRLTRRRLFRPPKSVLRSPKDIFASPFLELSKDVRLWRDVYDSSENILSFRKWLQLMHKPGNSRLLGEGYGNTVIADFCGFMTYRYLYLCCQNITELKNSDSIRNYDDLFQFENRNCYIEFFVRQESLERDLCEVLEKIRPLTKEERDLIQNARKSNTSRRSFSISEYYDKESIEIVRHRERLLIEKFDYSPPPAAG